MREGEGVKEGLGVKVLNHVDRKSLFDDHVILVIV